MSFRLTWAKFPCFHGVVIGTAVLGIARFIGSPFGLVVVNEGGHPNGMMASRDLIEREVVWITQVRSPVEGFDAVPWLGQWFANGSKASYQLSTERKLAKEDRVAVRKSIKLGNGRRIGEWPSGMNHLSASSRGFLEAWEAWVTGGAILDMDSMLSGSVCGQERESAKNIPCGHSVKVVILLEQVSRGVMMLSSGHMAREDGRSSPVSSRTVP
ncbi:hypothetical protein FB451DRAFT_1172372 [Mycena latifolia]|nr:hypothetical protein FB451DRAFT_1172372 [Mycena latifolia]